jgi:RNA polymerase sigma-70 factor, ECF subfamily
MATAYPAHRRILLARAFRVLGDPDLAEEAVQEAMLRGWRACSSFDPADGPLANWLLAIAGNVAIDLLRARARRPWLPMGPADEETSAAKITGVDLLLLRVQLQAGLARLETRQAVALAETFLRDRPPAQVAARLGIPAGTLRTRVHYALRRLQIELKEMDAAA